MQDFDIIRNFRTLKTEKSPTVLHDGPARDRYKLVLFTISMKGLLFMSNFLQAIF